MQLSLDQSYFGRIGSEEKVTKQKLKKIIKRMAFQIIQYCHRESKRLKKRHQYQTILFPNDYEYDESDQVSHTLKEIHQHLADYPFYLTQCQLFIDNYHLKVIKRAPPLPIKFANIGYGNLREFASWVQQPQNSMLIGVTTLHIILVVSITGKFFYKYHIQGKKKEDVLPLVNASVHKDYLFAFSQQECHIIKYQNRRNPQKGLEKIVQKVVTDKKMTRGEGIERDGKFYIFMLVQHTLIMQRLEPGILLSKIDCKNKTLQESKLPFINLAIHPKRTSGILTHVIIAIATVEEVKLLSYSFQNDAISVFASKENPVVIYNCAKQPPFLKFIHRESYLLCAIGFKNRLYFANIEADYCQFSRRVKFEHPIEYVNSLGSDCGLVIVTNFIKDGKNNRKIYVTHEDKLVSYIEYIFTDLVDKFEMTVESTSSPDISVFSSNKGIYIYDRRQIFILGIGEIQRVVLNTWEGIYNEMKLTENIKLLKFLILLNHIPSPFLHRPSSFDGLENFFPANTNESKQILLQYYYHMDLQPLLVDITRNYELMVPFVLAHQISNLSQSVMESLLIWCMGFDERLVEEMIIGGSNCGWEIAVSRGWIRAFKVMVQRGMELEMPVLKLYSMAYFQLKATVSEESGERKEWLTPLGQKYLNQMIEYILFLLANFFQELLGNGSNLEFKHILTIILKEQIWNFMIRFQPIRAISVISSIFCSEMRIKEINKYSQVQFIHFHRRFKEMRLSSGSSNSENIVAHLSATYQGVVSAEDMEYLQMEHGKLLVLRYEEYLRNNANGRASFKQCIQSYQIFVNEPYYEQAYQAEYIQLRDRLKTKYYFQFQKDYQISILKTLIKDQGKNLQQVYFSARSSSSISRTYEEVECEMLDFLVFIWMDIYLGLMQQKLEERCCDDEKYGLDECQRRFKAAVRIVVRQILAQFEGNTNQEQLLCIHLLLATNADGQNSSKIFAKFLACKNSIIRQRVFPWLRLALGSSAALQEELIVRLKDVIAVNHQQSRALLQNFYVGREKEIIKKIDNDPQLQLEYLELIIKNANEQLELYYTNLHLQLVLKLKPDHLIDILETNNEMVEYDIAEALRMTLAAPEFDRKNDTLIYLYEREGEMLQCINTYLTTFEVLIFSYIALCQRNRMEEEEVPNLTITNFFMTVNEHQVERANLVGEIDKKFEDSIRLLFRMQQRSYDHLARYLRKLNSIWKAVASRDYKFKSHYVQFITEYFGEFLVILFERNCLLELAEWLEEERVDLLQFLLQMKGFLVEGYDQMLIQLVILRSMATMEKQMLIREITQTVKKLQFCISSAAYCFVCDRPFGEEYSAEGLLFNCGHLYHKSCIDQVNDQDFCYYCVSRNQYKSMIQNQSLFLVELLKKFREKRRQKKGQEEIRVQGRKKEMLISQGKKRANRLTLYDKKVTAIENQAEIIDMKLLIEEYYSSQAKR